MLLATDGKRPGMVLKILQGIGQTPTTKNYPDKNVCNSNVDKLWFGIHEYLSFKIKSSK